MVYRGNLKKYILHLYVFIYFKGRLLSFELIFEKLLNSHDQVISSVDRSCLSPVGRYTFSLKKSINFGL